MTLELIATDENTRTDTMVSLTHPERTLAELRSMLAKAKEDERAANAARVLVEKIIIEHPDTQSVLKATGTTNIDAGIKIVTGETKSWNQSIIQALHDSSTIKAEYWPFDVTWKPNTKALAFLEERFPELHAKFEEALTTKPKKPAVTVTEPADL